MLMYQVGNALVERLLRIAEQVLVVRRHARPRLEDRIMIGDMTACEAGAYFVVRRHARPRDRQRRVRWRLEIVGLEQRLQRNRTVRDGLHSQLVQPRSAHVAGGALVAMASGRLLLRRRWAQAAVGAAVGGQTAAGGG